LKVFERLLWVARFIGRQEKAFKANMLRASLQNFAEELTRQFQSVYIYGLGASASELGAVNSVRGAASAATSLLTGLVADRYGLRAAFAAAMLFAVLGSLMLAAATSWIVAAPALLVFYLGLTMSITACPVVCGAALRDEERATGRGICDTVTALPPPGFAAHRGAARSTLRGSKRRWHQAPLLRAGGDPIRGASSSPARLRGALQKKACEAG